MFDSAQVKYQKIIKDGDGKPKRRKSNNFTITRYSRRGYRSNPFLKIKIKVVWYRVPSFHLYLDHIKFPRNSIPIQMRVHIFGLLSEPDKRSIRLCCKQLKLEIDTLVGLNVQLVDNNPIKSNQLLEWIQSLRINQVNVRAENMTTSELMVLLQNRAGLQSVGIWYPKDFDLIPVLTMLSGIDTLQVLYMSHACKRYLLGFLPISVYRFSRLRRMDISLTVDPEEMSLGTAHFFLHVRCPQLQDLSLSVSLELDSESSSIVFDQKEYVNYFRWLLDMIEIFPCIRFLSVELRLYTFTPLKDSEYVIGE